MNKKRIVVGTVVIGLVGGCVALVSNGLKAADGGKVVAEQFLDDVVNHDFDAASAKLSAKAQSVTEKSKLQDMVTLIEKHNGKLKGHSEAKGTRVSNFNGTVTAQLGYDLNTEKGNVTTNMTVVREGDKWKVQGFFFNP